jgi:hypothetical protein
VRTFREPIRERFSLAVVFAVQVSLPLMVDASPEGGGGGEGEKM